MKFMLGLRFSFLKNFQIPAHDWDKLLDCSYKCVGAVLIEPQFSASILTQLSGIELDVCHFWRAGPWSDVGLLCCRVLAATWMSAVDVRPEFGAACRNMRGLFWQVSPLSKRRLLASRDHQDHNLEAWIEQHAGGREIAELSVELEIFLCFKGLQNECRTRSSVNIFSYQEQDKKPNKYFSYQTKKLICQAGCNQFASASCRLTGSWVHGALLSSGATESEKSCISWIYPAAGAAQ